MARAPSSLPLPLRALNGLARPIAGRVDLSVASLLAAARAQTGIADTRLDAGPDPEVSRLLSSFVAALEREAELTLVGRVFMRKGLIRLLANRLRVLRARAQASAAGPGHIDRPIVIVGFPRTGTTLLHNLLACDPELRAPRFWELMWPCPDQVEGGAAACRARAERTERTSAWIAPRMQTIHRVDADGPEECYFAFQMAFANPVAAQVNVPSYLELARTIDYRGPYRFHREVLLQLAAGQDTRWVLKAPMHLHGLDALLEVYPGARIIRTHRDPVDVAASCCSLYATTRSIFSDAVDRHALGREWLAYWGESLDRAVAVREASAPEHFIDVDYEDLCTDALAQIERIYAALGRELSDLARARMRAWLDQNPAGKHGRHVYALEDYGLSPDRVRRRFAAYLERHAKLRSSAS